MRGFGALQVLPGNGDNYAVLPDLTTIFTPGDWTTGRCG